MTFRPGSRPADTPGLCGARTRQPGNPPCRNFGMRPSGRCRLHGGRSLRGMVSRSLVHGWYSQDPFFLFQRLSGRLIPPEPPIETSMEANRCATPPDTCNEKPHAIAITPCGESFLPKQGVAGVTQGDVSSSAEPDFEWSDELLEALMGPPKTRQQRGLPPTPEELGRAAAWCAQDRETDVEIARRLGIGRRALEAPAGVPCGAGGAPGAAGRGSQRAGGRRVRPLTA